MHKHNKYIKLLLVVLLAIMVASCGSSSSNGSSAGNSASGGSGILAVSLTDKPNTQFSAVFVTVVKVRVHKSADASDTDAGWSEIVLNPPQKIDLLSLTNGVLESLGQTALPAGHYTQIRLVLAPNSGGTVANSVVISGTDTEIPLFTPSAVQSGIKLINEFDVAAGQRVDLVLDFDALKSIVSRGNGSYGLKPVIHVLPTVVEGITGIDGFVDTALLADNVIVSAQVNGTESRSTAPNITTGEFFLDHLAPGSYDVVITADGHATAVIAGVPVSIVTSTALVTMVSTSAVPITMPTSTFHNISGTVLSSLPSTTPQASVATKQTFTPGGPTVMVKSTATDMLTGEYTLALPIGAPMLGSYGTGTLPRAFTPQPVIGGKYAVEASAPGFITESVEVDITISDIVSNFTLTTQ